MKFSYQVLKSHTASFMDCALTRDLSFSSSEPAWDRPFSVGEAGTILQEGWGKWLFCCWWWKPTAKPDGKKWLLWCNWWKSTAKPDGKNGCFDVTGGNLLQRLMGRMAAAPGAPPWSLFTYYYSFIRMEKYNGGRGWRSHNLNLSLMFFCFFWFLRQGFVVSPLAALEFAL